ncbi:MAG: hypothetical protein Q8754_02835 [Sweet potato little leaf phytoplasma]|nr:hypothetical protein [Sweet potato little leaf phytoplasma]
MGIGQGAGGSNKDAGASGSVPNVEPPYVKKIQISMLTHRTPKRPKFPAI